MQTAPQRKRRHPGHSHSVNETCMSEKPFDRSSRREWFAHAAALSAAFASALPAAEPPEPPPAATCPASGGVPPSGASLPEIAQIASGPDHVLRATISVE